MVKIEENENFHPRRKMTSSLKMAAFLEFFFAQNTLYKSLVGTQNFRFIAAVVKKSYYNLNLATGQKVTIPRMG